MKKLTSSVFVLLISVFALSGKYSAQSINKQFKGSSTPASDQTSYNRSRLANPLRGNGMMFTQNGGQIVDMDQKLRPDVLYKGEGGGVDIYLRKTGISYVLSNDAQVSHEIDEAVEGIKHTGKIQEAELLKRDLMQKTFINIHRIDVDFMNCKPNPIASTADQIEGVTNYYYNHCPEGVTHVKSFNEITLKNIYNNIDVKYYGGKSEGLKYDIIVNPGGDPNNIKLKYSGADNIEIKNDELIIKNSVKQIIEKLPKVYQNINGEIVDVKAEYKLERLANNDVIISFSFSRFNASFPLVIDPWASYYSGNYGELGFSVTTDPSGNVAFTGQARSSNLPTSPGSFQTTVTSAGRNVFAVKMTSAGVRIWGTYYGNVAIGGAGWGIASDASGNICVAVSGAGTTFPVGAIAGNVVQQATGSGEGLIKFDPLFGTRIWATFYGSSGGYGGDVVTDGSNIYLCGSTSATTNIATAGTFQPALNGTMDDAFVAKFAANGSLIWGTYVGGSGSDQCNQIEYDPVTAGVYIVGYTLSTDFPTTTHQVTFGGGGVNDAFLFKLSSTGGQLWSTYYGGSGSDYGCVVTSDGLGNVIIGGVTGSNNNISSVGAYQPTSGGGTGGYGTNDVFIAKFNSTGVRQWGTYFGGNQWELINGIDVDAVNNIYISGEFEDADAGSYPISACAYQPTFAGKEDGYIVKYGPNGNQVCITFMGGPLHDEIAFDNGYSTGGGALAIYGNVLYIVGCTEGSYPVTPGAFQTVFGGAEPGFAEFNEAYIAQMCINICEGVLDLNFTAGPNSVCSNAPVTFTPYVKNVCDTSGYKFQWTFTGGNPSTSTAIKPTVTYPSAGNYSVKLLITTPCKKDSLTQTVVVNSLCIIKATATSSTICPNSCATLTATGASGTSPYSYIWSTGATTQTINVCPATNTNYLVTITDASGNKASAPASVIISSPINATPSSVNVTCTVSGSASITVNSAAVPYVYSWSNGSTGTSIQNIAAGNYTVTVTDGNGCTKTNTYNITSTSSASAAFTYPPVCLGSSTTFTHTGTTGTYYWQIDPTSPTVSSTSMNFSYTFLTAGTYNVTHNVTTGSCTNVVIATIKVINCSAPTVTATGSSICTGSCATVTATGSNGISPYSFSWSNGSTTQNISPCPTINTTYTVTITDSGGATATSTATVTINPVVSAATSVSNINCNGDNDGSATVNPGSGTAPFTFNWSNGGTTSQISNLTPQNYTVTVTDGKGCTATSTALIISPPPLSGQFTKGSANCIGCGCKEWVMVTANGGTSPYTYAWPDGYVNRYKNKICPGPYSINVIDKNGCSVNINLTAP